MKKYINILFAATVAALTMLSCQPKEEPYEAGPKEADNCYGVYFPTQDASGSHVYNPTQDKSMEITLKRTNTKGAITVPMTKVFSEDGVFTATDANFADGQDETTFTVRFDKAEEGVEYKASFVIEDNNYASIYNSGAIALDFSVLCVDMQYFLNPVTKEKAVFTFTQKHWGETAWAYIKFYEVNGIRTCFTETFDHEYKGEHYEAPGFFGTAEDVGGDGEISFIWYTNDKNGDGYPFVEVPVFNYYVNSNYPDYVVQGFDYYYYWTVVNPQDALSGMSWLEFAKKYNDSYPLSYYDNNGGFHIYIKTYYMLGLGGWTQDEYDLIGLADGFTRVDYSLSLESDYSVEGITPIYVEAGIDVESLKYAVYEGELNSAQLASKVEAISKGTEEGIKSFSDFVVDEEEAVKYATMAVELEKTGNYTLVAVAFDAEGKPQNDANIAFRYISAEDTDEYAVDIMVGAENVPERYVDYDDISAFGYYIVGNGITDAHAAIITTAKYNDDPEYYNAAIKADTESALSAEELALVNAEGGFYAIAAGLAPLTSYTLLVWATNGDLETVVTAEHTTDGLPLEYITTGTYTYDGWWSGADDEQKLYQDPNYENTYVLTNWGGGVDFKFTMDSKGEIHIPTFYIGANHSSYGPVYYVDPFDWYTDEALAEDPEKAMHSYYDKETGAYNFHFVLAVSAGSFGHFWESFVPASESTQNAAPKMASSKVSLKEKNPGKAFVNFLRIPAERDPQPIKAKVTVSHNKREKVSGRNQVEFSAR